MDRLDEVLNKVWADIDVSECNCRYQKVTEDPYNTGGAYGETPSPTIYDCMAREYSQCPRLFEDLYRIGEVAEEVWTPNLLRKQMS